MFIGTSFSSMFDLYAIMSSQLFRSNTSMPWSRTLHMLSIYVEQLDVVVLCICCFRSIRSVNVFVRHVNPSIHVMVSFGLMHWNVINIHRVMKMLFAWIQEKTKWNHHNKHIFVHHNLVVNVTRHWATVWSMMNIIQRLENVFHLVAQPISLMIIQYLW
jgi:hypothetical protein